MPLQLCRAIAPIPPVNSFSSIKNSVELRRTAPAAGGKAPFWIADSDYLYLNI